MLKMNFKKIFGSNWQSDWELITSQSFVNLLGCLGENKLINLINKERKTKYPINVILSLRDYFNSSVPLSLILSTESNHVHDAAIDSSKSGRAYLLTVRGNFTVGKQGKYELDFRKIFLNLLLSEHVIECKQTKCQPDEISYAYVIKVDPTIIRYEDQQEYIKLECGSLSIRVDIFIKKCSEENLELKSDINIIDEIINMNSEDKALAWKNIRTKIICKNFVWLKKIGLPSWVQGILNRSITSNPDDLAINNLLILSGLGQPVPEGNSLEPSVVKRHNDNKFTENRRPKFINVIKPDMSHYSRRILGIVAPSTLMNIPIILSNRGLKHIFLPGVILLVKRAFYTREMMTQCRYHDTFGWHTINYIQKINRRNLDNNYSEQTCFDWRKSYQTACKSFYSLHYQSDFLSLQEYKKLKKKTKQEFEFILQRVQGDTLASKLAMRGILLINIKFNRKNYIIPISAWLSLADYVTPSDFMWAKEERKRWNASLTRHSKSSYPLTWLLRNQKIWDKPVEYIKQYQTENYSNYLSSLSKDLLLSRDLGDTINHDIRKKYLIGKAELDHLNISDKTDFYGRTVMRIKRMTGSSLIDFWHLHPDEITAKLFFSNLSEAAFNPDYFDEYIKMMVLLPVKLWEKSKLFSVMLDYSCQVEHPNPKFISLFSLSWNWRKHPLVELQVELVSDQQFIKQINQRDVISKIEYIRYELSIINMSKNPSIDLLISVIRLNKIRRLSLPKNSNLSHSDPFAFRFCYFNRSSDQQIRYVWSNRQTLTFVPEDPSCIWNENKFISLATNEISINRPKLLDTNLMKICKNVYYNIDLSIELLSSCYDVVNEEEWQRLTPVVLDRIQYICRNDEKQPTDSVDWAQIGSLCLKLLQIYRAISIIYVIGYTYHKLSDDDGNKNLLADIIASLDTKSTSSVKSGDDVLHHRKVFAIQNRLKQGKFTEVDFRGYLTYVIQQDNFHDTLLISMAKEYFEKTGLYYPYGDYLVLNWEFVPDSIRSKSHIRQMLFLMTNRLEKKLRFYMQENKSDQNCVITLIRLWEQTGHITPLIEEAINWIIYRIDETELIILQEIINAYIQVRQERAYLIYLYMGIYNHQSNNKPIHPKIIEASKTKQYVYLNKFLQERMG